MESWLNLVTEAVRGNTDARETVRTITGASMRPDEMVRVMTRFMPAGVMPMQTETVNEWLEEYWKSIGVVPRYRYLDLLERYEQLRLRVEELEQSKRHPMMGSGVPQTEDARKVMDLWGTFMQETIKAQQSLLQTWMPNSEEGSTEAQAEGQGTKTPEAADAEQAQAAGDKPASQSKPKSRSSKNE
jgi:hypothetical protein